MSQPPSLPRVIERRDEISEQRRLGAGETSLFFGAYELPQALKVTDLVFHIMPADYENARDEETLWQVTHTIRWRWHFVQAVMPWQSVSMQGVKLESGGATCHIRLLQPVTLPIATTFAVDVEYVGAPDLAAFDVRTTVRLGVSYTCPNFLSGGY